MMTILFTYILFNIIFKNDNYLINLNPIEIIISTIVYIIFIYFLNKIFSKKERKKEKKQKFLITTILLLMIIQLFFAYIFAVIPGWDFGAIYESSLKNLTNELAINENPYFYRYGNNLACVILLTIIYTIPNLLGVSSYTIYGVIGILFNILCIDIGLIFIYKILKMYFTENKIKTFWLLTLICTPFITYVPIFYTDTISLPFVTGGIYYLLQLINKDNKKMFNAILGALLLGIGCCLKFTIIIILIGFLITYLMYIKSSEKEISKIKITTLIVIAFIIPTLLLNTYKSLTFNKEKLNKESFPITHWIMMGLTGNGGYNQSDVDYTGSYDTKEKKKKANIKVINQRLNNLIHEKEIISFYTNKTLYVWGDGTFFATAKLNVNPINDMEIKEYILPISHKNHLFTIVAQTQLIIILLFIIIGIILNNYLSEKEQILQKFLNITIFGIFLFFLIWEARSRYLVNMLPVLLLSSYLGIKSLFNFVKGFKESRG